ncbi:hypothetical protein BAnh1_10740 [Bartonella australis AUST/NH1]|uniref:Anti-sigma factor NepR domain-containing protein n=1 Tax=Bartonella australis (strain Aust/NH1) TaxID=1094489 RepID=M1NZW7_BARAA|nr:NepR family anti-sigma factor [Bartonella australis]AGF74942.1 hypothetical protein BAnh1_10740 [Bartonella australis AUST/NH1]
MNDSGEKSLAGHFTFGDDLLGVNSEIALKLRQFYMKVQEETIPIQLLELLEKLDQAERASSGRAEKV